MMDPQESTISPGKSRKFPVKTLFIVLVIFSAAAAVFVFQVPWSTVLSYGFFGLMMSSHFFMHGAHGEHHRDDPSQPDEHQNTTQNNLLNPNENSTQAKSSNDKSSEKKDSHNGHSGCC